MGGTVDLLLKRQQLLADFGDFALQSDSLDDVLTEACRIITEAMGTKRAKVLEIRGDHLFVRAGLGWAPGVVGHLLLPMSELTSESFSIEHKQPVITNDIRVETRFPLPRFLEEAGVIALANVPILLPGGDAYGLLQVDATEPRDFDEDDTQYLRTYATILGPIIDRLFKVRDLRSVEEQFRFTVEAALDYAILMTNKDDVITDWLPGAAATFGWSVEEAVGQAAAILFTPEDREAGEHIRETETARKDGYAPNVRWHMRKDGTRVFIDGFSRALHDAAGEVTGFIKIGRDATESQQWQERQKVLIAELQHRTRNLLGVVRSLADQTILRSKDLPDFAAKFGERIGAVARVQGLLARLKEGERVPFHELLEDELASVGAAVGETSSVTLNGPRNVPLRSSTVQTLTLAIHELCTNALKYGALKQPNAHLTVRWHLINEAGQPWLSVDWRETGVAMPPQGALPEGTGTGRELIEQALPYQFGAKTTYVMEQDGVHCTLLLPASQQARLERGRSE